MNNFWINYLTQNLIKVISFLGIMTGGTLFLAYYFYIGYFPVLANLTDLTYMLFAMALIGTLLIFFLAISFIFPAFFFDYIVDKDIRSYISNIIFLFSVGLFPFVLSILLLLVIIFEFKINASKIISVYVVLFVLLLIGYFKYGNSDKELNTNQKIEIIFTIFMLSIVGYIPLVGYIIFLLSGQSNIVTESGSIIMFFIFGISAIFTNGVIIHEKFKDKFKNKPIAQVSTGIAIIFIMMLMFGVYAIVPSVVMHYLHLGNFTIEKIYSKNRSCNLLLDLNTSNFKIISFEDHCKIEALDKNQTICILSNIGNTMLWKINIKDKENTKNNILIELPKEDFFGMEFNSISTKRCVGN